MAKLFLRVNGIPISRAKVRNRLEGGSPFGRPEVVVEVPPTGGLPGLGEITLEDRGSSGLPDFKIEVKAGGGEWREMTPRGLAALLGGEGDGQEKGH